MSACLHGWLVDCTMWHPRCADAEIKRLRAQLDLALAVAGEMQQRAENAEQGACTCGAS